MQESKSCALPLGDNPTLQVMIFITGWVMGLEPTTPGTTIQCYYQLSYTHHITFTSRVATHLIYHDTNTYVKHIYYFFIYFFPVLFLLQFIIILFHSLSSKLVNPHIFLYIRLLSIRNQIISILLESCF